MRANERRRIGRRSVFPVVQRLVIVLGPIIVILLYGGTIGRSFGKRSECVFVFFELGKIDLFNLETRRVALDGRTPHKPTMRQFVIQDCPMLHRAVVPNDDIADLPFVLINEFRFDDVICQGFDQRRTFLCVFPDNRSAVVPHDIQTFASRSRMASDDWMLDRRVLCDIFRTHWRVTLTATEVENPPQSCDSFF